ncbi:hypothetical protein PR048_024892 [Dryococelus australis]|uniref:Uncharacterized protein n=1 Tax=Dryococelus australis TaxID=614101 RepID=A0ABQ9GPT1_9NEOP|nr:hypothetical protein PR048_024892 [Dryococelus australis]
METSSRKVHWDEEDRQLEGVFRGDSVGRRWQSPNDMVSTEQRWNERAGKTGNLRENPPTNGIVRHGSHMRKSGVIRPGIEPGSPWWEASSLIA